MSADHTAGHDTRAIAHQLVLAVIERGRALDDAFDAAMARSTLSTRDRAFVRRLATGTLRHFGQSEAIIARLLDKKPLRQKDFALRALFAMAASELVFLETPPHAAINGAVNLSRSVGALAGQSGLINAVLRRLSREGPGDVPVTRNIPDWLYTRWSKAYGAQRVSDIAQALMREPPLDIAVKADRQDWAQKLDAQILPNGTLRRALGGRIEELPGFEEGAWWVQDAAAALPPLLLQAKPGDDILDLCAAPGGKTATLLAQGAKVTALDKDGARLKLVRENLTRLKLEADLIEADLLSWQAPRLFGKILLDAPCSATGTIRRHPDIPWLKGEKDIAALAKLQTQLLDAAATALKPGGILVYAVCSLEREEGENRADHFLKQHQDFVRAPIAPGEIAGLEDFVTKDGDLRTTPAGWPELGGLDGFFAARFIRKS